MCGFFGWVGKGPLHREQMVSAVSKAIHHRGPDDEGFHEGINFGLGFRRLSILDLSEAGHQPMKSDDSRFHIVFNGEIFNHNDLRERLEMTDLPLKGHSDTEVLFKLLSRKGETVLSHLNGMFAFVFVDSTSGEFLIARDRLGVKPLHYSLNNGSLFFASELPALLEFGLDKQIDELALNRYIRFGHISPPLTIFKGIFKLEPGTYIKGNITDPYNFSKHRWWQPVANEDYQKAENAWLNDIDELLFDATRIRLESDVPVGLFLSGGIDSSLVAHYASKQSSHRKPNALSVVFSEKEFNEFNIASEVAKAKELELIPIEIKANNLSEIDKVNRNIGEPFSDASLVNQYYLSQEARKHATVFLSGDGGDEAFAGYTEYIRSFQQQRYYGPPSRLATLAFPAYNLLFAKDSNFKQQLSKLAVGPRYLGAAIRNNFMEPVLTRLVNTPYRVTDGEITDDIFKSWDDTAGLPFVKRMQVFDYTNYLEPDVLVKVDRATMLHSIEARSPFLDYRMVELGLSIPNAMNIANGKGKVLLRKLAARHLPESVIKAPKRGFGLPIQAWITTEIREQLVELNRENGHHLWDKKTFEYVARLPFSEYDMYTVFWRVWMFEIWYKNNFRA